MRIRNVIIDGNNYISICLYRARSNILRDAPDKLDEYIEGAVRKLYLAMLKKLQREFGEFSNYFLVWDSAKGSSWRRELVQTYKSNRKHLAELPRAINIGKQIANELLISNIEIKDAEADDVIYALCKEFANNENIIVSRDNDMIQIVQEGLAARVFDPVLKKDLVIPNYDIVLFKALVGDSSDNIPGIRGVGPVSAVRIIEQGVHNSLKADALEKLNTYIKIIALKENPRYNDNAKILKKLLSDRMVFTL